MGGGDAVPSIPASGLIHMQRQACPHNHGCRSPYPEASITRTFCQAVSRKLEGSCTWYMWARGVRDQGLSPFEQFWDEPVSWYKKSRSLPSRLSPPCHAVSAGTH